MGRARTEGARTVAPDRTALAAGMSGLASAAFSAATRALIGGGRPPPGTSVPATPATLVFATLSMAGFFLGVFAIWSAVKAWLRDDYFSPRARLGAVLGAGAMLVVVATGPCGPQGCPG
jgi:hypothetical protein